MPEWKTPLKIIEVGKGRKIRDGEDIAILTIGHIGNYAVQACAELGKEGLNVAHYDMRFVKPLDEELLHEVFSSYTKVITVEDGCVIGGMGSAVLEFMADKGYNSQVKRLGIPDEVIEHGSQMELHTECGFHPEGIADAVRSLIEGQEGLRAG
jgi:1-deoxy-D-xylulose-5-phosphate synthase